MGSLGTFSAILSRIPASASTPSTVPASSATSRSKSARRNVCIERAPFKASSKSPECVQLWPLTDTAPDHQPGWHDRGRIYEVLGRCIYPMVANLIASLRAMMNGSARAEESLDLRSWASGLALDRTHRAITHPTRAMVQLAIAPTSPTETSRTGSSPSEERFEIAFRSIPHPA